MPATDLEFDHRLPANSAFSAGCLLPGLAIVSTFCFSSVSMTLSSGNPQMTRDRDCFLIYQDWRLKLRDLSPRLRQRAGRLQLSPELKLKPPHSLRPKLRSCNKSGMSFSAWLLVTSKGSTNTRNEEERKRYIKLHERLNQVLMEKKKETKSGMEIMNLLQKECRQRGMWNGKKADNDFYKKFVDAYESKNQELVAENNDLRALPRSMQTDMRDFFNAPNGTSKQSQVVGGKSDVDPSQSPLGGRTASSS
ncbi:hypothetical protein MLD38_007225 [Melastoma candidum]|uniref:Uncharacterized protein n=1 Tax=Melastoma candidum TaxID=119954 RepID=A0ACB9RQ46_9MYRT|nr:hypothetical protein MLD38_007225 [Melastoma candidum]